MENYRVGLITSSEPVAGKDKLRTCTVDVGLEAPVTIVSNAPNAEEGVRTVVAMVGAVLKNEAVVKKATVGGVVSEGMLCDSPMLGWTGGAAGVAAAVPASFALGDAPPSKRPRMDGGDAVAAAADDLASMAVRGPGDESLFKKKLTKEEKKAAAAAKKAERAAKKGAK